MDKLVVSELLAFVSHWILRSSKSQLEKALIGFYSPNIIKDSKALLKREIESFIPEFKDFKLRQKSTNRDAHEADADDIVRAIDAYLKIERDDGVSYPVFVARDLSLMPSCGPESLSLMNVMEQISKLSQRVTQLDEGAARQIADALEVRERVDTLEAGQRSYASVTRPGSNAPSSSSSRQGGHWATAATAVQPSTTGGARGGGKPGPKPPRRSERVASVQQAAEGTQRQDHTEDAPGVGASAAAGDADAEEVFTLVGKSLKRPNKGVQRKYQSQDVRGTVRSSSLSGGMNFMKIRVRGVNLKHKMEEVSSYIVKRQVEVEKIEEITQEHWDTRSFVVTVPTEKLELVLDGDFWPENVSCRKWYPSRKPRNLSQAANNL